MNNYKETGLDSLGRKFWVLKFTNTEKAKKSNIFNLSFYSRVTEFYEFTPLINSSLTFISVGDKIFTEKRPDLYRTYFVWRNASKRTGNG